MDSPGSAAQAGVTLAVLYAERVSEPAAAMGAGFVWDHCIDSGGGRWLLCTVSFLVPGLYNVI